MHRRSVEATDKDVFRFRIEETPAEFLAIIHSAYSKFLESWEVSAHEPSRMLELFINIAGRFYRCKNGVSKRDYWLLEQESCD